MIGRRALERFREGTMKPVLAIVITAAIATGACESKVDAERAGTTDRTVFEDPDADLVAAVKCVKTEDRAVMSVESEGLQVLGCSIPDAGRNAHYKWEGTGRVIAVEAQGFEMDSCVDDSGCGGPKTKVRISANDLDLTTALEPGALVKVHGESDYFYACTGDLVVESVETWNGIANPSPAPGGFYVAAFEAGGWSEAPYRIQNVRLDCAFENEQFACNDPETPTGLFAIELTPNVYQSKTVLPMGETVSIPAPGVSDKWRARNLRTYQTSYCDDYWNYAYWIAREP
jgi:hypothetical protein